MFRPAPGSVAFRVACGTTQLNRTLITLLLCIFVALLLFLLSPLW
jgi:hypothetical protein